MYDVRAQTRHSWGGEACLIFSIAKKRFCAVGTMSSRPTSMQQNIAFATPQKKISRASALVLSLGMVQLRFQGSSASNPTPEKEPMVEHNGQLL
jgi:hypothetical protein